MTTMPKYDPEHDSLQDFRTQYLKLIALFWQDGEKIMDSYERKTEPTLQWMADQVGAAPVPWTIDLSLKFMGGPVWNPGSAIGRLGWLVETQIELVVYLPVTKLQGLVGYAGHAPIALAAYLRQAPTLQSAMTDNEAGMGGASPEGIANSGPASLPTMHQFREFQGVCARLLAVVASQSPEGRRLWERLQDDKACVREVLSDYLDYDLPWSMNLIFRDDPHALYSTEAHEWTTLSSNRVTLALPQKPADNAAGGRVIALASYNETGADHPLTCP